MKTPVFYGVCLSTFSFRRLHIWSNVLCVHALPVMLAFVEHHVYLLTYLLTNLLSFQTASAKFTVSSPREFKKTGRSPNMI